LKSGTRIAPTNRGIRFRIDVTQITGHDRESRDRGRVGVPVVQGTIREAITAYSSNGNERSVRSAPERGKALYPKTVIDEVRELTSPTGIASRVRIRLVDLDAGTVGVVFSENRIPDLDPAREVVNPGTAITSQVEWLAHLVEDEWKLLPADRQVRWFEHYAGLAGQTEPDPLLRNSTFIEIIFRKVFDRVYPYRAIGDPAPYVKVGNRYIKAESFRGRWRIPAFRRISLDEGRKMVGFDL
jgi:hypothetical protein